jgi:hypothetical protein
MKKIWTFKENELCETDLVDISKTFKASGKFYEDVELLSRLYNIKVHPALKPLNYGEEENKGEEESKV